MLNARTVAEGRDVRIRGASFETTPEKTPFFQLGDLCDTALHARRIVSGGFSSIGKVTTQQWHRVFCGCSHASTAASS